MCGLTGILFKDINVDNPKKFRLMIEKMTSALSSRGPDDEGVHINKYIAMGHRRLKIIDLTSNASQPMQTRPNGPVLVFNGEIYNFKYLKKILIEKGHLFKSSSDTEVILCAYDEWGINCFQKLEGIFSFAIWDNSLKKLFLVRDRLGVKPLYYANSNNGFIFGSEMKSIITTGGFDNSLNDQAFSEYLWYGNTYEDRSFYRGIKALLPGHALVIDQSSHKLINWWKIEDYIEDLSEQCNSTDFKHLVKDNLNYAVNRQLVSDVPVGLFLSGGIDSSGIASAVDDKSRKKIKSYSASFDFVGGIDETKKAKLVAEHLGLNHNHLKVEGKNISNVLFSLAKAHDEPFADAANIPLYLMCTKLDPEVKVVLQGDGGDELFAGYTRYQILCFERYFKLFPSFLSNIFNKLGIKGKRYSRIVDTITQTDPAMKMALLLTLETQKNTPMSLFTSERQNYLENETNPFLAYIKAAERFKSFDTVQKMLLTDLTVQLPSQFLTKVDRATMAAGIEARVPLLDEKILKLAVNIPSALKVNKNQKKIILRDSLRDSLPSKILDGPKTGFGVPYEYWIKTSLYEFTKERILDPNFIKKFHLKNELIEKKLSDHISGSSENGFILWKLLQLAIWMEINK